MCSSIEMAKDFGTKYKSNPLGLEWYGLQSTSHSSRVLMKSTISLAFIRFISSEVVGFVPSIVVMFQVVQIWRGRPNLGQAGPYRLERHVLSKVGIVRG